MKIPITLLVVAFSLAIAPAVRADDGLYDLSTSAGKSYRNCHTVQVDADGVTFRHANGMAKVLFTDLNQKWRDQFGYDPAKVQAIAQQKHQAKIKAREAAQTAVQIFTKAREEALTSALQRQTLITLQRVLYQQERLAAQQAFQYNTMPFGAMLPVGFPGYGSPAPCAALPCGIEVSRGFTSPAATNGACIQAAAAVTR